MVTREVTNLAHEDKPVGRLWDGTHGNFDNNREEVSLFILHSMDGTTDGSTAWFSHQDTSAHYGISKDGKLTAWIKENCVAYHAGKYSINKISIGVEHEDGGDNKAPRTPEELETSAQLLANLSLFYSVPLDRDHVKGHNEIVATQCPGNLPIDDILKRANEIKAALLNPSAPVTDQNDGKPPISITQTLFAKLVTKASSWDDVASFFALTDDQKAQPGQGKSVVLTLTDWRHQLDSKATAPGSVAVAPSTGIPVNAATASGVASEPGSTASTAPDSAIPANSLSNQGNSIWRKDVLDVLKGILSKIGGSSNGSN